MSMRRMFMEKVNALTEAFWNAILFILFNLENNLTPKAWHLSFKSAL